MAKATKGIGTTGPKASDINKSKKKTKTNSKK